MLRILHSIPVESLKLLVFDLDGTLIDSAQDLCNSVNAALNHVGFLPLTDRVVASFVGNGAPMLVRRALAECNSIAPDEVDERLHARTYNYFLTYYREHKLDFTYAYDGVLESLKALRELHEQSPRAMAVLTNKPVRPAQGICEGLGLADFFVHIYGGDSFTTKKPNPEGMLSLIEEVGARPEETVMIGDSRVDVQTARNAGTWVLGCDFGFGPRDLMEMPPDILVDRASDWIKVLGSAQPQATE